MATTTENDLMLWAAFQQAHAAVADAVEDELRGSGLGLPGYEVLFRLARADDGAMRMQELAELALVTPSGITRVVDRLEDAGYVTRRVCTVDRRGTEAVITAEGRKQLRAFEPRVERAVAEHFGVELSAAERRTMLNVTRKLLERHGRTAALDACDA